MPKEQSKALAVQASAALTLNGEAIPDYLLPSTDGREQIDQSDLSLPRLVVMNALSKPVQSGDVKVGSLMDTVSGNVLYDPKAGEPIKGVFLAVRKMRNKWRSRGAGEGIECHSPNGRTALEKHGVDAKGQPTNDCGSCIHAQFIKAPDGSIKAPACTEYRELLFLAEGYPMPLVISLGKSAAKDGKRLIEKLNADMGMTGRPIYAFQFAVSTDLFSSKGNQWWGFVVKPAGFPSKELAEKAQGLYKNYCTALNKQDYRAQEREVEVEAEVVGGDGGPLA